MIEHHCCHAEGCVTPVQRRMLMCRLHWGMVPRWIREKVYGYYRPGQESGRAHPSSEWLFAARLAIEAVREAEASP